MAKFDSVRVNGYMYLSTINMAVPKIIIFSEIVDMNISEILIVVTVS